LGCGRRIVREYVSRGIALTKVATNSIEVWAAIYAGAGIFFGAWVEQSFPSLQPLQVTLAVTIAYALAQLWWHIRQFYAPPKRWYPKTRYEQLQAKGINDHSHRKLNHRHPYDNPDHDHGQRRIYNYRIDGF
jgi:hypothetical protein